MTGVSILDFCLIVIASALGAYVSEWLRSRAKHSFDTQLEDIRAQLSRLAERDRLALPNRVESSRQLLDWIIDFLASSKPEAMRQEAHRVMQLQRDMVLYSSPDTIDAFLALRDQQQDLSSIDRVKRFETLLLSARATLHEDYQSDRERILRLFVADGIPDGYFTR